MKRFIAISLIAALLPMFPSMVQAQETKSSQLVCGTKTGALPARIPKSQVFLEIGDAKLRILNRHSELSAPAFVARVNKLLGNHAEPGTRGSRMQLTGDEFAGMRMFSMEYCEAPETALMVDGKPYFVSVDDFKFTGEWGPEFWLLNRAGPAPDADGKHAKIHCTVKTGSMPLVIPESVFTISAGDRQAEIVVPSAGITAQWMERKVNRIFNAPASPLPGLRFELAEQVNGAFRFEIENCATGAAIPVGITGDFGNDFWWPS